MLNDVCMREIYEDYTRKVRFNTYKAVSNNPVVILATVNVFELQVKPLVCVKGFKPFPINNYPDDEVFEPVPPHTTGNVPSVILLAFKVVNPEPLP